MNQSPYYQSANNPNLGQPNPQINSARASTNIANQAIRTAALARTNNLNPNN